MKKKERKAKDFYCYYFLFTLIDFLGFAREMTSIM